MLSERTLKAECQAIAVHNMTAQRDTQSIIAAAGSNRCSRKLHTHTITNKGRLKANTAARSPVDAYSFFMLQLPVYPVKLSYLPLLPFWDLLALA